LKTIKIIGPAYPFRGGLAAYNERLAREFATQGYQVEIETFTLQYPKILFPGKTQYADWPAPEGLKIKQTVNSINPLNWLRVGNRLQKEKPDVVIFKYWLPFMAPCFGTIIRMVKRNKHTRVICIADNIVPHEKRIGDKPLTAYFIRSIDGIVAMSQSVYDDILKFRANLPRTICPHPLFDNFGAKLTREESLAQLKLDPSFRYMLFFGFIRKYKGLDLLLKAMAHPAIQKLPVRLIVAGEFYTDPQPYLDLIRELGLQEKVVLCTHFISDNEVAKYFCAADIVVQPYKHATQSGVTQIAYHFENPMLVTTVGGLPEIVPDQKIGYVVDPDEQAVASALTDFFTRNRRAEFEANIQEEKKKFTWDHMVRAIFTVLNQNKTT
jgi:glycosyltransferase involved in cell wall biosynthesis